MQLLVLLTDLIGQANLCVLQLSWLRVVGLLPGQLLCEAISQPDVQVNHMVAVHHIEVAALYDITNLKVPVHQSHTSSMDLEAQDAVNSISKLTSRHTFESFTAKLRLLEVFSRTKDNNLILTLWGVPQIFGRLHDNVAN